MHYNKAFDGASRKPMKYRYKDSYPEEPNTDPSEAASYNAIG